MKDKQKKQYITRKGNFDSGHRVMNERMKCFSIHGHTYLYELTFSFNSMKSIGYAIDFKEIKRVMCQWVDDYLDHGMILNPMDTELIQVTKNLGSKLWLMSLAGTDNEGELRYCNPTVENIATEVCCAMKLLTELLYPDPAIGLRVHKVKIYETPNCFTVCKANGIWPAEYANFVSHNYETIRQYATDMGVLEYDDRLIKQ